MANSLPVIDNTQNGYYNTYMMRASNISDALFPKVRQRVLGLFFTHPDMDFYTNEIIRLTDSGTGAVQRELDNLAGVGLINVKQLGNQKRYQVNQLTPLYTELRSIILKTFGLADVLRSALKPIENKIKVAFIYGSIAKHSDTAHSDIDLLIITDELSYSEIFQFLEESERYLARKINPTLYSLSEWCSKNEAGNSFIIKIQQQSKIFLVGNADELNKLR